MIKALLQRRLIKNNCGFDKKEPAYHELYVSVYSNVQKRNINIVALEVIVLLKNIINACKCGNLYQCCLLNDEMERGKHHISSLIVCFSALMVQVHFDESCSCANSPTNDLPLWHAARFSEQYRKTFSVNDQITWLKRWILCKNVC